MRAYREDLRAGAGRAASGVRGLVRRLRISAATGVRWLLVGYDDGEHTEEIGAEVFVGAGFASRPSEKGEAIVLHVGGAGGHPVVVATRDPAWLAALGQLEPGEAAIFNATSVVRIKADGTIAVGTIGGEAVPLATKADVAAIREWLITVVWTVATTGSASAQAGTAVLAGTPPPAPAGTSKLRGE